MLVDFLLQNFDVKYFMETHGYKMKYIGGATYYITTCPFCGKHEHCGINPKKKIFGCYKCHEAGNWIKLIKKVTNKTFVEVIEFLKLGVDLAVVNANYMNSLIDDFKTYEFDLKKRLKSIALPDGYIPLGDNRIPYLDRGRKFPIPQDQVKYYKMGYCVDGLYKNRLIVCDVDDNQVPIYWVARDMTGLVPKKQKLFNPSSSSGVGSGDLLFNFFLAKNYSTAIITEGVFDALYIGNNGLATYGEGIKKSHLYWIIQAGFEEIILLYDADVPYKKLADSATKLSLFCKTRICQLPKDDPDDYPKDVLFELLNKAPIFSPKLELQWN